MTNNEELNERKCQQLIKLKEHEWINIGLINQMHKTNDNFTTDFGIKFRKIISPCIRFLLKLTNPQKIIIEQYPELDSKKQYIFAATHYYKDDIAATLAAIDRNAWVLMGTTDQIEHNPESYVAWANGFVYVDRFDKDSRNEAVLKMSRIIKNGSNILIFPEGGWNNSENLLVLPLFAGPWLLAQQTRAEIVPVASFYEHGMNKVWYKFGSPIDLFGTDKSIGIERLRDDMAKMEYELIEAHSTPIVRNEYGEELHHQFMKSRAQEYFRVKWTRDVWDEELTVYHNKSISLESSVWGFLDSFRPTSENAGILASALVRMEELKNQDFKEYMHKNWKLIQGYEK